MSITHRKYRPVGSNDEFRFTFVDRGRHVDIFCTQHPGFGGRDPSVTKTHIYGSRELCFHEGMKPRSQAEAELRAAQWAAYLVNYIATGVAAG
ncbi:MAG: hypothetical protein AB7N70_35130 [Dehalococcoidia bacterium]